MDPDGPVAAIDCGTNSTRLLVVDRNGSSVERQMRITRLGQGVDSTGELSHEAVSRTLSVLTEYHQLMDHLGVVRGRLAATSAVRDAANGDEFLANAGDVTGLTPELLSGEEEGRLSLGGAVRELDPDEGPFLVVDIGGGSTELVFGTGADDPDLVAVSLQLGCVRITERYLRSDPPTVAELGHGEAIIGDLLDQTISDNPRFLTANRLVGLAGTVTTLAALNLGVEKYDRDLIHHTVLDRDTVARWYRTLASEVRAARLDRAGMVPGREDVIAGGAMILSTVMTRLGFAECLVSEADILDGMVATLLVRQ